MDESPAQQIEFIVRELEKKGIPAAPMTEALALATTHPKAVSDLAVAVMKRFPKGGTFLDAAFTFLPQEDWPQLVCYALDVLEGSRRRVLRAMPAGDVTGTPAPSSSAPNASCTRLPGMSNIPA